MSSSLICSQFFREHPVPIIVVNLKYSPQNVAVLKAAGTYVALNFFLRSSHFVGLTLIVVCSCVLPECEPSR